MEKWTQRKVDLLEWLEKATSSHRSKKDRIMLRMCNNAIYDWGPTEQEYQKLKETPSWELALRKAQKQKHDKEPTR